MPLGTARAILVPHVGRGGARVHGQVNLERRTDANLAVGMKMPPCWRTMPYATARPKTRPRALGLGGVKGSNTRSSTSGGMPVPVSVTVVRT